MAAPNVNTRASLRATSVACAVDLGWQLCAEGAGEPVTTCCGGGRLEAWLAPEGPPAAAAWSSGTLSVLAPAGGSLDGLRLSPCEAPKESPHWRPAPAAAAADCGRRAGKPEGDGSLSWASLPAGGPSGPGVYRCCEPPAKPPKSTGVRAACEVDCWLGTAAAPARAGVTDRPRSSVATLPPLLGLLLAARMMAAPQRLARGVELPQRNTASRCAAQASRGKVQPAGGPHCAPPARPTGTFLQAGAESSCAEGTACRPSQLSAWTLPVAVPICGATESPIALSSRVPNERRAATVLTSMPGARHHGVMSLVPGSCGPGGPRGTVPAGPFFLTPALGSACAAVRKASCAKVT